MNDIKYLESLDRSEYSKINITPILHRIREQINCCYFQSLEKDKIRILYNFLWKVLDNLYQYGPSHVRVSVSSILGSILIKLSPFYSENLLSSLLEEISSRTTASSLLISSFCYLAKFFSPEDLEIKLYKHPLLHMFSEKDSDHLCSIIDQLYELPKEFLLTLAEYLFSLGCKHPGNRHFPRAASKLFRFNPDRLSRVINDAVPLHFLASLFPKDMPLISSDVKDHIITRAKSAISENKSYTDVEYGCSLLYSLYNTKQINKSLFDDFVTLDMLKNSKSLGSMLILPLDINLVKSLYIFDRENKVFDCDSQIVIHLIRFFKSDKNFEDELYYLTTLYMDPCSEYFPEVLNAIPSLLNHYDFSNLLINAITIPKNNWVQDMWIVQMLGEINYNDQSPEICQLCCETITRNALSKSEKIQDAARCASIKIIKTMPLEYLKLYVNLIVYKLDPFNTSEFDIAISYLAFLFNNIDSDWYISFSCIVPLLYESVTLFRLNTFIITNIFIILSKLAYEEEQRSIEIMIFFIKYATTLITESLKEFTGEEMLIPEINVVNRSLLPDTLVYFSTVDIAANPDIWHTEHLSCATSACSFLSKVKWSNLNLRKDQFDLDFLIKLITGKLPLYFPAESLEMFYSLIISINTSEIVNIVGYFNSVLSLIKSKESMFTIAKISGISSIFDSDNFDKVKWNDFPKKLYDIFIISSGLSAETVAYIVKFLSRFNFTVDDSVLKGIVDKDSDLMLIKNRDILEIEFCPYDDDSYNACINNSLTTNNVVDCRQDVFSSLSPFIYHDVHIPDFIKTPKNYILMLNNTKIKLTKQTLSEIMEFSFIHKSKILIKSILTYCYLNKVTLNIDEYLDKLTDPYVLPSTLKLFPRGYSNFSKAQKLYFNKMISDVSTVTLRTKPEENELALSILELDPEFVIKKIGLVILKAREILRLFFYIQKYSFPIDDILELIRFNISKVSKESKKYIYLLRTLSLLLIKYKSSSQNMILFINDYITDLINQDYNSNAELVEISFMIINLSRLSVSLAHKEANLIIDIIPPSTYFGFILHYELSMINSYKKAFKSPFPSINFFGFRHAMTLAKMSKNESKFFNNIFKSKYPVNHFTESFLIDFIEEILLNEYVRINLDNLFDFVWAHINRSNNSTNVHILASIFRKFVALTSLNSKNFEKILLYSRSITISQIIKPSIIELSFYTINKESFHSSSSNGQTRSKSLGSFNPCPNFKYDSLSHLQKVLSQKSYFNTIECSLIYVKFMMLLKPDVRDISELAPFFPLSEKYNIILTLQKLRKSSIQQMKSNLHKKNHIHALELLDIKYKGFSPFYILSENEDYDISSYLISK